MIKENGKDVVIYADDYRPVNLMRDNVKLAGYEEVTLHGKEIHAKHTYNDKCSIKVYGEHTQVQDYMLRFNQLCNFTSVTLGGSALTKQDNEVYYATEKTTCYVRIPVNIVSGHKYYVCFDRNWTTTHATTAFYHNGVTGVTDFNTSNHLSTISHGDTKDTWYKVAKVVTAKANAQYFDVGMGFSSPCDVYVRQPIVIDLTLAFGSGYEPTEEIAKKMFPCLYPYNTGEWIRAPKGAYVNFNQLVKMSTNTDFAYARNYTGSSGSLYTYAPKYPVKHNRAYKKFFSDGTKVMRSNSYTTIVGHKYLIYSWVFNGYHGASIYLRSRQGESLEENAIPPLPNEQSTQQWLRDFTFEEWAKWYFRKELYTAKTDYDQFTLICETQARSYASWGLENPQAFDLTQMFGYGNEPETYEDFRAMFAEDYYEYVSSQYKATNGFVQGGQLVEHNYTTAYLTPNEQCACDIIPNNASPILSRQPKYYLRNYFHGFSASTTSVVEVLENTRRRFTVRALQNYNNAAWGWRANMSIPVVPHGHMIYYCFDIICTGKGQWHFISDMWGNPDKGDKITTEWKHYYIIDRQHQETALYMYHPADGGGFVEGTEYTIANMQFYDLTKMFGDGNEPKTEEEFHKYFPKDYYEYEAWGYTDAQLGEVVEEKPLDCPYVLYGDSEVQDTYETCVEVNGAKKSRYTRRWQYYQLTGQEDFIASTTYIGSYYFNLNSVGMPIHKRSSKFYCNMLRYESVFSRYGVGECISDGSLSFWVEGKSTVEEFKVYLADLYAQGKPMTILYQLDTPIVELSDPVEVPTKPTDMIFKSECPMDVTLKVSC